MDLNYIQQAVNTLIIASAVLALNLGITSASIIKKDKPRLIRIFTIASCLSFILGIISLIIGIYLFFKSNWSLLASNLVIIGITFALPIAISLLVEKVRLTKITEDDQTKLGSKLSKVSTGLLWLAVLLFVVLMVFLWVFTDSSVKTKLSTENISELTGIIFGLIGISGILLVIWGANLLRRQLNKKVSWGLLLTLFGIFGLSYVVPQFGTALIVLGTLVLAFAAFWSIRTTIEHDNAIRNDDRLLESKKLAESRELEFKRRTIAEVIDWVKEVQRRTMVTPPNAQIFAWRFGLIGLVWEGRLAGLAAEIFSNDLQEKVLKLSENINKFVLLMPDQIKSEKDYNVDKLGDSMKSIIEAANQIIETAYQIKLNLKL